MSSDLGTDLPFQSWDVTQWCFGCSLDVIFAFVGVTRVCSRTMDAWKPEQLRAMELDARKVWLVFWRIFDELRNE